MLVSILTNGVSLSVLDVLLFFFNDTATTEIYTYGHTLSLHDALPISACRAPAAPRPRRDCPAPAGAAGYPVRTSRSRCDARCRVRPVPAPIARTPRSRSAAARTRAAAAGRHPP